MRLIFNLDSRVIIKPTFVRNTHILNSTVDHYRRRRRERLVFVCFIDFTDACNSGFPNFQLLDYALLFVKCFR